MIRILLVISLVAIGCLSSLRIRAQAQELEQLALDIEKLIQMKSILNEMYDGYKILTQGYNAVKNLAEGNFNLHNAFLTSLLTVNPTVKSYVRVADIISDQQKLVAQYKAALAIYTHSGAFSAQELNYFTTVYNNLVSKSLENLDELVMVLTDSELRMSDAERIAAIDHIYADMQDKLSFLHQFNGRAGLLGIQRERNLQQINLLRSLIGQ